MRKYELTYLVSDDASETELTKVTGEIGGLISGLGGEIIKEESWGRRKLAYPINKISFATYVTVNFKIDPEKLMSIKNDIKNVKHVLRHLIVVKDYGKEELTLSKEDVAESQEIAEVAGGEKSVEAATEKEVDSRDLMAKRDKEEETEQDANKEEKKADKSPAKKTIEENKKAKKEVIKKSNKEKETEKDKTSDAKKTEAKAPAKGLSEKKKKADKSPAKKKAPAKKAASKKSTADDEAERLTKLDEELDELLKDDI